MGINKRIEINLWVEIIKINLLYEEGIKMNILRMKIPIFISTSILVISVIILIVITITTSKVNKLQYYDVEGDRIPSITHVVGE